MDTLLNKVSQRRPMLGAAVGSGMSAKAAAQGGADFLMVLSAGFYRAQGQSSMLALLPYGNANQQTWQIASEQVMPGLEHTPLILGLCAQDPQLKPSELFARIKQYGMTGVTNFPSVAYFEGNYRAALEQAGLGFQREVELLAQARAAGLFTIGFCLTVEEAVALSEAKVHILCLGLGFAEWQEPDYKKHQTALDQSINFINQVIGAVKKITPDPYVVVLGGPVLLPQDTAQVYSRTEALGYIGGSTMERFPAAPVITQTVREFKEATQTEKGPHHLGALVGNSPAMQQVFETIRRVAKSNAPILIIGETGTGKELVAKEIHRLSSRRYKPLVTWNCGAMTESLAMSELFGHEKGSFTGAMRTHLGRFEVAQGGTLFMDEITDLPLSVQASLLRVLQEREVVRVGGEKSIPIDVRLIAASNKNFQDLIPAGQFRLDLYYRLNTVALHLPPLRARREDIPILVGQIVQELALQYDCPAPRITDKMMELLVSHSWPGNIRELRNVLERCFILGEGKIFSPARLEEIFSQDNAMLDGLPNTQSSTPFRSSKRKRLMEALTRHNGNKMAAARELGVARKTIYNWLNE